MKKIRRQKLEKQKAEKLRAEEAAINISQPDFSETEEITPAVKKRKKSGSSVLYDILDVAEWVITVSFTIILFVHLYYGNSVSFRRLNGTYSEER